MHAPRSSKQNNVGVLCIDVQFNIHVYIIHAPEDVPTRRKLTIVNGF